MIPAAVLAALVAAEGSAAAGPASDGPAAADAPSVGSAADRAPSPAFARAELRFGIHGASQSVAGDQQTALVPRFAARYRLAPTWQLEAEWALGVLLSSAGVIEDRRTGETTPDDTPRVGNPFIGVRHALVRAPSGFSVDAALGVALPMASIPKPTPATGPDFERTPHTEATYRRALAVTGFARPWLFLWNTGSLVGSAYVRQQSGPIVLDVEPMVALLVPAGRLRTDAGLALGLSAYAGVELGALELGMRADMSWVSDQRDELDGALQISGAQLALSPELTARLGETFFVRGAWVVNAAIEVDPRPENIPWGLSLELGARF